MISTRSKPHRGTLVICSAGLFAGRQHDGDHHDAFGPEVTP